MDWDSERDGRYRRTGPLNNVDDTIHIYYIDLYRRFIGELLGSADELLTNGAVDSSVSG